MISVICQEWPWVCYWRAQGKELAPNLERSMALTREAGFDGWEGMLPQEGADLRQLGLALQASGLGIRSLYENARLHEGDLEEVENSLLRRCLRARGLGMQVLVLNPEPIRWGAPDEKSALELERQAGALRRLGARLGEVGVLLAYHVHDSEMRSDGRELRAMLEQVPGLKLCLECEWQHRGGWSGEQVLDFVRRSASQVASVHLRQSRDRRPRLELDSGDIDYLAVRDLLKEAGFKGPLVYEGYREGAVTEGEMLHALKAGAAWMRQAFF